jgi:heme-degrading monooxygenase HmoA
MPAFIHTITLRPKTGCLNEGRAEIARMAQVAEAEGAKARMLLSMAGDTNQGVLVIEFDSGEAWATFMQSEVVREARRARFDEDFPLLVERTSVYQEIDIART